MGTVKSLDVHEWLLAVVSTCCSTTGDRSSADSQDRKARPCLSQELLAVSVLHFFRPVRQSALTTYNDYLGSTYVECLHRLPRPMHTL